MASKFDKSTEMQRIMWVSGLAVGFIIFLVGHNLVLRHVHSKGYGFLLGLVLLVVLMLIPAAILKYAWTKFAETKLKHSQEKSWREYRRRQEDNE